MYMKTAPTPPFEANTVQFSELATKHECSQCG